MQDTRKAAARQVVRTSIGMHLRRLYDDVANEPIPGHLMVLVRRLEKSIARAYDEAQGLDHPRVWTAERDLEMWQALEQGTAMKSAELHS